MFPYIALIVAQLMISVKMYAMKICGRRAGGAFNSVCINAMRALICLAVSVVVWLLSGGAVTNLLGHLIILLAGIGTAVNLFTWILASRLVSLTLLEIVCMMGSMLVPMVLAPYLFGGEQVALHQWLGGFLIIVAAILFVNKEKSKKEGTMLQKIAIVVGCAASVTLATISKKLYSVHIESKGLGNAEYYTFMCFVVVMIMFAVLFAVFYSKEAKTLSSEGSDAARVQLPYKKVWMLVCIAAIALYVCELFAVYANRLPAAIYLPLSKGLNIFCTFLLDTVVFKDKVSVKKICGLVLVLSAIVIVNL